MRFGRVDRIEFRDQSEQLELGFVFRFAETLRRVYREVLSDVVHLLKGLLDEDEGDQGCEVLLREAGDVADEGGGVGGDKDQENDPDPDPDAKSEREVVPPLTPDLI